MASKLKAININNTNKLEEKIEIKLSIQTWYSTQATLFLQSKKLVDNEIKNKHEFVSRYDENLN